MKRGVSLGRLLDRYERVVNKGKLQQLRNRFAKFLGKELCNVEFDDPIVIRRSLIEGLKKEGVGPGTIQAQIQFFMGIVRRAAVDGIIQAPAEGPWTRTWQSVLDFVDDSFGLKARIRSVGGWATEKHLEPSDISQDDLCDWAKELVVDNQAVPLVEQALHEWKSSGKNSCGVLRSDERRARRLKRKARGGTVRVE